MDVSERQRSSDAVIGGGLLGVALGARPSLRQSEWSSRFGVARPLLAVVAVAAIIPLVVVLAAGIHLRNSVAADNANDTAMAASTMLPPCSSTSRPAADASGCAETTTARGSREP